LKESKVVQSEWWCENREILNLILLVLDETMDISTTSQLSIVITYVHGKKRYEDFVEFIDVHKAVFENREASQEP
jgi:hypothetical protein